MGEIRFSKINIPEEEKRKTTEGQKQLLGAVLYENNNFKLNVPEAIREKNDRKLSFLPFKLREMDFFKDPIGELKLGTHFNHQRAAELPKTAVQDKCGNIFFRPTVKGLGFLYPEYYESYADDLLGEQDQEISLHETDEYPWGYKVLGLVDKRILTSLINDERELTKAGLRCETIAGALELRNVIINEESAGNGGKKIPAIISTDELKEYLTDEAEELGLSASTINDLKNFSPILLIRLTRDNQRIKDFCKPLTKEEQKLDARKRSALELQKRKQALKNVFTSLNLENELKKNDKRYNLENQESVKEYLKDTFKAAGRNLAVIQNSGKMMTFLNSANITLSLAEIVDLDSMIPLLGRGKIESYSKINPEICGKYNLPAAPLGYLKDARDELFAVGRMFLNSFTGITEINDVDKKSFYDAFVDGYEQELNEKKLDIILKKNLIASINDDAFDYELSMDTGKNQLLTEYLRNNRSEVSGIIEYPPRLETMENGEEKEKITEILTAFNKINEAKKIKLMVENIAKRIIIDGENIKSVSTM